MKSWQNQSHPWWFENQNTTRGSMWLRSTLSELDEKTKGMLKLIEDDADSFAKRAEMFYKKRPELITMVEDFYRSHRSLAVRFDLLKSDSKNRLKMPLEISNNQLKSVEVKKKDHFSDMDYQSHKLTNPMEKSYDTYSENSYSELCESEVDDPEEEEVDQIVGDEEESAESEVDDPEQEQVTKFTVNETEVTKLLREEIERLKVENRIQKEQLMQKDEEKREVIRQLSSSLEIMNENVTRLRKCCSAKESSKTKNPLEFNKLKGLFSSAKLFGWTLKGQTNTVAL